MPDYPTVLSSAEIKKIYGAFSWKSNGASAITILGSWVSENVTTVYIPELDGVSTYGGRFNGRIRWHRKGVEQLQRAWAEVGKAVAQADVVLWGGSFVPRRMRGGSSLSRHSWAVAFDINPAQNAFRSPVARPGMHGSVWRIAPIMEKHGFAWGGRWNSPDGMHFELAGVREYAEVDEVPGAKLVVNDRWQEAVPLILKDGQAFAPLSALMKATSDGSSAEDRMVPVGQYLHAAGYAVHWQPEEKKILAYKNES